MSTHNKYYRECSVQESISKLAIGHAGDNVFITIELPDIEYIYGRIVSTSSDGWCRVARHTHENGEGKVVCKSTVFIQPNIDIDYKNIREIYKTNAAIPLSRSLKEIHNTGHILDFSEIIYSREDEKDNSLVEDSIRSASIAVPIVEIAPCESTGGDHVSHNAPHTSLDDIMKMATNAVSEIAKGTPTQRWKLVIAPVDDVGDDEGKGFEYVIKIYK